MDGLPEILCRTFMNYSKKELWERFQRNYTEFPSIGLAIDLSRMRFDDGFFARMEGKTMRAFDAMEALEKGAIANPDENRMVGHYWLRNPDLSPTPEIRDEIKRTLERIQKFTAAVHAGFIKGQRDCFKSILVIGIGGSSLGPQFVANALSHPKTDKMKPFFLDNTDPDGIQRTLASIGDELRSTLCIVISKSGGTKETRNGMLEAAASYTAQGLDFSKHAIAVTRDKSVLHEIAIADGWLDTFPMWDWVGGRTSELSAVGLLPAALQGFDIQSILKGASACDELTRIKKTPANPAAQLALMWYYAGEGKGSKNMVVIPYKDRLELFARYLQQLIMESLGKELDLDGNRVNQGISVFGNKGSTDQHSYIQQLRDGNNDFFVTFIEVLSDGNCSSVKVENAYTTGDYLAGFYLGTRQALFDNGRDSLTITTDKVSPEVLGALIALFERAVGYYASLININAYHQPGVEAGKKAAELILRLQTDMLDLLSTKQERAFTCTEMAASLGRPDDVEHLFKLCERLSCGTRRVIQKYPSDSIFQSRYQIL